MLRDAVGSGCNRGLETVSNTDVPAEALVGVAGIGEIREQFFVVTSYAGALVGVSGLGHLRKQFVMVTLWAGMLVGVAGVRDLKKIQKKN